MKKFPKLPHLSDSDADVLIGDDDTLVILEKIDGANFRWQYYENGSILAGSRNVVFKDGDEPQPLEETNKQFRHTIKFIEANINVSELETVLEEYGELTFFGESLHTHTINYSWSGKHPAIDDSTPNFLGFDIWNETTDSWLSHTDVKEIYDRIGLETVPVIKETTVDEISDEMLEIPQSVYRKENPDAENEFDQMGYAEGIVVKNDISQNRAKKVADYMSEVNQFGVPDDDETIEEMKAKRKNANLFVRTFVTDARIKKQAHKLIDEGEFDSLEMPMMAKLPEQVLRDIFTEEGWNIINHKYEIELTEASKEAIRQETSKKCSRVLKDELF